MANISQIIKGLEIIKKHEGEIAYFAAGHDQIWAGEDSGKAITEITDEEKEIMDSLGWFIDEETDSWSHFT